MLNKTQMIFFLLAALCAAVSVATQQQQPPAFPFPFPLGYPVDVVQCWSSITNIQGCVTEIYQSIISLQFGSIGPACCKALLAVDANCWQKMFPFSPFFPPMLKDNCARFSGASPPASK